MADVLADGHIEASLEAVKGTALPAESQAGRDAAVLGKLLDVETPVQGDIFETIYQIAADVAGLDGEPMRGTDGALLANEIEEIANAVWAASSRTLTGSSIGLGPSAVRSRSDGYYICPQGGTVGLYRRILDWNGDDLTPAEVASISYSIYALSDDNPPTRTVVEGHDGESLNVADVLFDTVQSDEWASDYNFRHIPDVSTYTAFAAAGTDYLVEYMITPLSGQLIIERFKVLAT
jgi:hypothetical protein